MSHDIDEHHRDFIYKENARLQLDNSGYRIQIEKLEITIQQLHKLTGALGLALSNLINN